jgi:diguanylate cyclase (GGDEF)-like protein
MINLRQLNDTHGHAAGDSAVRWATLVLLEEAEAAVYRISGDEFVGVLTEGTLQHHAQRGEMVYRRLTKEAKQVNLDPPGAALAVIHFSGFEELSPEDVLGVIYGALLDVKQDHDQTFKVFDASSTKPVTPVSGLINDMVRRMISLGSMLDKSHVLAYIDSVSGLPNMHAALDECEAMFERHKHKEEAFSILLIDGDDLSRYNKIGYLAGDEMIARLGSVLRDEMRPGDFLARWRSGDEFLVLLERTPIDLAVKIANRLRERVIKASQDWTYPITISIGIAGYPGQGRRIDDLIHQAETALNHAKQSGKDQAFANPHVPINGE